MKVHKVNNSAYPKYPKDTTHKIPIDAPDNLGKQIDYKISLIHH